jgi:nucleotidyltransferase substrate binding protein (TIGR01987 family)
MNARLHADFEILNEALSRLEEAVAEPMDAKNYMRDVVIQRFEFSFELTWKTIKKLLLQVHGVEVRFPKDALQQAYKADWITNEALWVNMLEDRNLTSHTYNKKLAQEIYNKVPAYTEAMRTLYATMISYAS